MGNIRYRIAIQQCDPKYKHLYNIVLETNNIRAIVLAIKELLSPEIEARQEIFKKNNPIKPRNRIKNLARTKPDTIDWKSKSNDNSNEEYLRNEIEAWKE